jgi:hypothetical protein
LLPTLLHYLDKKCFPVSTREEDPDWFLDLTRTAATKEEYMFKSCQARIRQERDAFFVYIKLQIPPHRGAMRL